MSYRGEMRCITDFMPLFTENLVRENYHAGEEKYINL
jgi:hypothetical protein